LVLPVLGAILGVAATAALAVAAIRAKALTAWAGVTAFAFGALIVIVAGFAYLALLVLFVVASVLATRYALEEKTRRNVQEGTAGERGVSNVLAHILPPAALAVSTLASPRFFTDPQLSALYASAMAFGASDTFASEFGVLQGRAVSILTFRPVAAGTNGGVSALGTAWAAVGALTTAVAGLGLFWLFHVDTGPIAIWIAVVSIAGFVGCQIDSLVGETLENARFFSKGDTNFLSMTLTTLVALLLLRIGGIG
jgi:uncharacterized protein (TIGR00297 family)